MHTCNFSASDLFIDLVIKVLFCWHVQQRSLMGSTRSSLNQNKMLTEQLAFFHWHHMNPYTDTISSIVKVKQVCMLLN